MARYFNRQWRPYIRVAARQRHARQMAAEMKKAGRDLAPIEVARRKITSTFWGNAWCENLEAYSDYSNRLPRGRTYVRNGSVIDLQIETGRIRALVSGSDIYEVNIGIKPLPKKKWIHIKRRCSSHIGSLVELLQGSISRGVMESVTRKGDGLFPSPREITFACSCPDWAYMCKHLAATLYGVGARLDHNPEMLFALRGVDPTEMVEAAVDQPSSAGKKSKGRVLKTEELSAVFGVDIDVNGMLSNGAPAPAKLGKKTRHKTTAGKSARSTADKQRKRAKPAARKSSTTKTSGRKSNTASKAAPKKAATKKKTTKKKVSARKSTTKKAATKRPNGKRSTTNSSSGRKSIAKKAASKKTTAKKRNARKSTQRPKK